MTTMTDNPDQRRLYEQVAERVSGLIASGVLGPGDRVPSIRQMREQASVSVSTVLEAYRLLEDRGLIRAQPQSGYFVRATAADALAEPGTTPVPGTVNKVAVRALSLRLSQELNNGKSVRLGAASPDMALLPLAAVNRCLSRVVREDPASAHAYAPPPGPLRLRRQLAKWMLRAGCTVGPDEIVATNGATEAVSLCLRSVTRPGDTVAIESPTYYGLLETMEGLGLQAIEVTTSPRDGIDLNALAEAFDSGGARVLVLNTSFSNPLGHCVSDSKKQHLIGMLERYDAVLIEDDIYGEQGFEGVRPKAYKAFDRGDHVMYCNSLCKTMSPALRAGWCVPGARRQGEVELLKLALSHSCATMCQLAAAMMLESGGFDRSLRRLRRAYRSNIEKMTDAVAREFPSGTRVTRPRGGHVLWVQMPEAIDSLALHDEASRRGISIAPGHLFSTTDRYRHCMRLNAALPWDGRVAEALATLGRLVASDLEHG